MMKTLPPDPDGMNGRRSEWADAALRCFRHLTGTDYEDAPGDLLCDLMHWCDRHNFDFDLALDRARGHYQAETEGEAASDLLAAADAALDYLTELAIDLDGEPEQMLAGIRIDLAEAIAKAKGGAS